MLDLLKLATSELLFTLIVPGLFAGFGLLLAGKFLPDLFSQYKLPATLAGALLVLLFTFEAGRYHEVSANALQIAQLNAQVAELKAKTAEVTVETVTKYVDKIKYVDRWKEVPVNVYIPKEADARCIINPDTASNIRMLYNSSNEGILPSAPFSADGTSSKTK